MNREKLLFECCRLLIFQIRTEQAMRIGMLETMLKGSGLIKTSLPTNDEVEARISELREVLEKELTKSQLGESK